MVVLNQVLYSSVKIDIMVSLKPILLDMNAVNFLNI